MTRRAAAATLAAAVIVAAAIAARKGSLVWPFEGARPDISKLLGPAVADGLAHAEIAPWAPDANYKPQAYFLVDAMTEDDFKAWAATAALRVSDAPAIPSGVFALPAGVTVSRWLPSAAGTARRLDAQGPTTSGASVWARWQDGLAYIVIHPPS